MLYTDNLECTHEWKLPNIAAEMQKYGKITGKADLQRRLVENETRPPIK